MVEGTYALDDTLVEVDVAGNDFGAILFACPDTGMSEECRLGTGHKAIRDSAVMKVVRRSRFGVECMTTLENMFSMRRAVGGLGVEGSVRDKELERYKGSKESGE